MDLEKLLLDTTNRLKDATQQTYQATLELTSRKHNLADAEAYATTNGLEGRNAEERKTDLYNRTTQSRNDLEQAEAKLAHAKLIQELATIDTRTAHYLLQLHIAQLGATNTQQPR